MSGKRRYTKREYFEFLFNLGFDGADKYRELAKILHNIDYIWFNRMDENTMYNGIEIRKYYLSDELGYMPDEIDEYDEYIFPSTPSVLEVLVGFSNRLCRDVLNWKVSKLMKMFISNLELDRRVTDDHCVYEIVDMWMYGELSLFGDVSTTSTDLWSQAAIWMQNL
jgi:hypothetical protein